MLFLHNSFHSQELYASKYLLIQFSTFFWNFKIFVNLQKIWMYNVKTSKLAAICTPIYSTPEKVDNSLALTTKTREKTPRKRALPNQTIRQNGPLSRHTPEKVDNSPTLTTKTIEKTPRKSSFPNQTIR